MPARGWRARSSTGSSWKTWKARSGPRGVIEGCRITRPEEMDRVVVAVDPPVTGGASSDACGIVVCGLLREEDPSKWRAVVLEDSSLAGASPARWAAAAVAAAGRWDADRIVAEVNNGGDLVEQVIRQVDPAASYKAVHASRGKVARAEPVAALYERGRVRHAGVFPELEAEMGAMTAAGFRGTGSPDRVDALVWAVTELLIAGAPRACRDCGCCDRDDREGAWRPPFSLGGRDAWAGSRRRSRRRRR